MTEERLKEIASIKERKDYIERFLEQMDPTRFPFKHGVTISTTGTSFLSSDFIDEQFEKEVKDLVIATHMRYVKMLEQALNNE